TLTITGCAAYSSRSLTTQSTNLYIFSPSLSHCNLHSFPTRRSSDLPVQGTPWQDRGEGRIRGWRAGQRQGVAGPVCFSFDKERRSEEHTSELQSLRHLVCRLLLEKKNCASSLSLVMSVGINVFSFNV